MQFSWHLLPLSYKQRNYSILHFNQIGGEGLLLIGVLLSHALSVMEFQNQEKTMNSRDDMVDNDWVCIHKQGVQPLGNLGELHPLTFKDLKLRKKIPQFCNLICCD